MTKKYVPTNKLNAFAWKRSISSPSLHKQKLLNQYVDIISIDNNETTNKRARGAMAINLVFYFINGMGNLKCHLYLINGMGNLKSHLYLIN
jgi:hypothetical protein